jgi:3-dehydrosphinganine reductase
LIKRGCDVTIVARDQQTLDATASELRALAQSLAFNCSVLALPLDLTLSYDKVSHSLFSQLFSLETAAMIAEAEKSQGDIDILVNNAGNSVQDAFHLLPVDSFERQMRLNYLSAVWATRAVVEKMQQYVSVCLCVDESCRRRSGHIAFVSSAAGQCAIWGYSVYAATKFALRGFADALQMELAPFDVTVSVLYPPNTNTEGFAVSRLSAAFHIPH